MKYFIERLGEPSTIAVIAGIAGYCGLKIDPGMVQDILNGLAALAALVAIITKEGEDV